MRAWLSRQFNGEFMLTRLRPSLERVIGSHHADLYVQPGDPLLIRGLCEEGTEALFGPQVREIEQFDSMYVELTAQRVDCE